MITIFIRPPRDGSPFSVEESVRRLAEYVAGLLVDAEPLPVLVEARTRRRRVELDDLAVVRDPPDPFHEPAPRAHRPTTRPG